MDPTKVVDRETWLKARLELLDREKALDKDRDALTRARQALPWVAVDKTYVFDGPGGQQDLSDLFEGRSQLIVYHFMYHPSWGDEPCRSCSFWADNFNGIIVHLNARDVSMVAVSKAKIAQIERCRQRMGWSFRWLSSYANDFNRDFQVSFTDDEVAREDGYYNYKRQRVPREEMPGMSVFAKGEDGTVYHTYSSYGRGIDMINGAYHLLDRVPKGRDEDDLPWNQAWVQRHDEYDTD